MMVAIAIKALVRMMVIVTMADGKRAIQVRKHAAELLYEASLHLVEIQRNKYKQDRHGSGQKHIAHENRATDESL